MGVVQRFLSFTKKYVFHRQSGGPSPLDERVDGHLRGTYIDLPIISRTNIRQFCKLLPRKTQTVVLLS